MVRRLAVLLVLPALAAFGGSALAVAQTSGELPRDQVVLSGDFLVARGMVVGEVVVVHGSATVLGVVQGDVIVVDGPATIAGQVSGDVVVLDGLLQLRDTAQVAGDVLTGDPVQREEGAQVGGGVREGYRVTIEGPVAVLGALLASAVMAVSTLILMGLLLLLAPRGVERLGVATRTAPLASAGWGVVVALVVPVASAVLVVSVLGIALGLATLLALGLVFLIGLAAAAFGIGRLVVAPPRSRVGALFAGWGILAVVGLVPLLNAVAWGLASVFGLGVVIVAAWRARGTSKHRVGGVAPSGIEAGSEP